MKTNHQIVVIGVGTAGLTVGNGLLRKRKNLDIAFIDPSEDHWYQPAWTLVGAGTYNYEKTKRPNAKYIPKTSKWYKNYVTAVKPEENTVILDNGDEVGYEILVAVPGIQLNIDGIEGLREALETPYVCSNYIDPRKTFEVLKNFKGGNAVFTQPATPIKCGGAPQKICYLADDYFRKTKVRDKAQVIFATPGGVIFGVPDFAKTLMQVIERKKIVFKPFYNPVKIDSTNKKIYFKYMKPDTTPDAEMMNATIHESISSEGLIEMPYDMLHLAPPQAAPDFLKTSGLCNTDGWVDVNINTMQHNKYPNIFSLGDAAGLPTAKTGAAIRKQAPVAIDNILKVLDHQTADNAGYTGYSSCPLVTGYGKMVLAEFGYENKRMSDPLLSKLFDTTKELWPMWILKKYILPYLYWSKMLKGNTDFN